MPYYGGRDDRLSRQSAKPRGKAMEPTRNETEATTELVTETLVEEVSIDGMCGVY